MPLPAAHAPYMEYAATASTNGEVMSEDACSRRRLFESCEGMSQTVQRAASSPDFIII